MPTKNAVKHGNWNDPDTWDTTTVPVADDDVHLGDYTVTLDTSSFNEIGRQYCIPPDIWHEGVERKALKSLKADSGCLVLDRDNFPEGTLENPVLIAVQADDVGGDTGSTPIIKAQGTTQNELEMIQFNGISTGRSEGPAILFDMSGPGRGLHGGLNYGGASTESYGIKVVGETNFNTAGNHHATQGRALGLFNSGLTGGFFYATGGAADAAIYKEGDGEFDIWGHQLTGSDEADDEDHYALLISENDSGNISLTDPWDTSTSFIKGGDGGYACGGMYNGSSGTFDLETDLEYGEAAAPLVGKPPRTFNDNKHKNHVKPTPHGHKYYPQPNNYDLLVGITCGDTTGIREDADPNFVLDTEFYANPYAQTQGTFVIPDSTNVTTAASYGVDFALSGDYVPPTENDVEFGFVFGNDQTGVCAVPDASNVRYNTPVATGLGTIVIPEVTDVRFGVNVADGVGTCRVPNPANVLIGVGVADTTGSLVDDYDVLFIPEG